MGKNLGMRMSYFGVLLEEWRIIAFFEYWGWVVFVEVLQNQTMDLTGHLLEKLDLFRAIGSQA